MFIMPLHFVYIFYYDDVDFFQEYKPRYYSSRLYPITHDARRGPFLTSKLAGRVSCEHGIAVNTHLRLNCPNSTCRYKRGKQWLNICVTFALKTTPAVHDRAFEHVEPLHQWLQATKSFRRINNIGKDWKPQHVPEYSNQVPHPEYQLA